MSRAVSHNGPPPSVGWWPMPDGQLRWWNGIWWSVAMRKEDGRRPAAIFNAWVNLKTSFNSVEWCDRPKSWPASSRT